MLLASVMLLTGCGLLPGDGDEISTPAEVTGEVVQEQSSQTEEETSSEVVQEESVAVEESLETMEESSLQ